MGGSQVESRKHRDNGRPRSWRSVALRKCRRAARCSSPGTPNSSPMASDSRVGTAVESPRRRPARSIHRRWPAQLPGCASPVGSRGHSRPEEASTAASKPAPSPARCCLLLVCRALDRMTSQIHRQHGLAAIGHVSHRIDGEVPIVATAVQQPQRHARSGLALTPVVILEATLIAAFGDGALRDSSSRPVSVLLLLVGHIRRAQKRTPLRRLNTSGLAFSVGLVANCRCPGKLRFQSAETSRKKEAHSCRELWASLFLSDNVSLSARAILSQSPHCHPG